MVLAATGLKFFYLDKGFFAHIFGHLRFPDAFPVAVITGRAFARVEFFLDHPELFP